VRGGLSWARKVEISTGVEVERIAFCLVRVEVIGVDERGSGTCPVGTRRVTEQMQFLQRVRVVLADRFDMVVDVQYGKAKVCSVQRRRFQLAFYVRSPFQFRYITFANRTYEWAVANVRSNRVVLHGYRRVCDRKQQPTGQLPIGHDRFHAAIVIVDERRKIAV